uniref:E2 ubiquitin-conjugating enzyme n=1 Tax=Megaviridae environmental sample TaxID=1737588 RepID=A0A5J6VJJ2_9VIRU|nr:MAG: ubiquitin-conjugating enzyme [Megaviridae environmental sample]
MSEIDYVDQDEDEYMYSDDDTMEFSSYSTKSLPIDDFQLFNKPFIVQKDVNMIAHRTILDLNGLNLYLYMGEDYENAIVRIELPVDYPACFPTIHLESQHSHVARLLICDLPIYTNYGWNPCFGLNNILTSIEQAFQISPPPLDAEIENDLYRLAKLCKCMPDEIDRITTLPNFGIRDELDETESTGAWNRGTGYGSRNDTNTFDPVEYAGMMDRQDEEFRNILISLEDYKDELGSTIFKKIIRMKHTQASPIDRIRYERTFELIDSYMEYYTNSEEPMQVDDDNDDNDDDDNEDYIHIMDNMLHRSLDITTMTNGFRKESSGVPPPKLARRAMAEFQNLRGLPLYDTAGVFIIHNEANFCEFKFLIIPSSDPMDDNPYAFGCYEFGVTLPSDYPASPPIVELLTTDGGRIRFNPNLYANGKVCLSLLNTWNGAKGEKWDPANSNLETVAISIQSLIFVSRPYFNEPGYEASMGTEQGEERNLAYNQKIQYENLRVAIIQQYKRSSPEFRDVIQTHIRLKHADILTWAHAKRQDIPTTKATKWDNMIQELENLV